MNLRWLLCLLGVACAEVAFAQPATRPRAMTDVPTAPSVPEFTLTTEHAATPSGQPIFNICYGAKKGAARGNVFGSYQIHVRYEDGTLLFPPSTGSAPWGNVSGYLRGLSASGIPAGTHVLTALALFKPSGDLLTGVWQETVTGTGNGILPTNDAGQRVLSETKSTVTIDSDRGAIYPRHGFRYVVTFDPGTPTWPESGAIFGQSFERPGLYWIAGDAVGQDANLPAVPADQFHQLPLRQEDWRIENGKLTVDLTHILQLLDEEGRYVVPTGSRLVVEGWRAPLPNEQLGARDDFLSPIVVY